MSSLVRVYSFSRCATCRKAIKWLDEHQIKYEVLDIVESPPPVEMLSEAIDQFGEIKFLFNTSGVSYRNLGPSIAKSMTKEEALIAFSSDGKLVKRPFLVTPKGTYLIGFKPDLWESEFCL